MAATRVLVRAVWMAAYAASLASLAPAAARAQDGVERGGRTTVTPYELALSVGYTNRADQQSSPGTTVTTHGATASLARVSGAVYPGDGHAGAWFCAAGERFNLTPHVDDDMPAAQEATLLDVAAALALRARTRGALQAELLLGYGYQRWPAFGTSTTAVRLASVHDHGPLVGARVRYALSPWLSLAAGAQGRPLTFAASLDGESLETRRWEASAGLQVGRLEVGGVRVAGLLEYAFAAGHVQGEAIDVRLGRHLLALGLVATHDARPPRGPLASAPAPANPPETAHPPPTEAPPPPPPPPAPAGAVAGVLWSRASGSARGSPRLVPLAAATVSFFDAAGARAGAPVQSDARGQFTLEGLPAGAGVLQVEAPGFEALARPLTLAGGVRQDLDLTLDPANSGHTARVRGTVRAEHGRRVHARVEIPEARLRVRPNTRGEFSFEVPPGHYTFVVSAHGYVGQQKQLELAGGEESIFSIELRRRRR